MKRRIDDFYDAIRAQDVDRIASWFTADGRHRIYSSTVGGQTEFAGEFEGVAAIARRFADFRQLWTITDFAVLDVVIDGQTGAARCDIRAIANTGRRALRVQSMHFLTFRDERLSEFDVFINEMQMRHLDGELARQPPA